MNADIGISNIVTVIVDSAAGYLVQYAPLFILVAGLVLAFGIIGGLIDATLNKENEYKKDTE
jgi:hypothetical protein